MPKRKGFNVQHVIINSSGDGYRHLAVSLIEHALAGAERGDDAERSWLLSSGIYAEIRWPITSENCAEYAGMDREVFREAMWRKFEA